MFDTLEPRIVVLKRPEHQKRQPEMDPAVGAEALRAACLHPAEAWVLKRRAGRPPAPSRRLPQVARSG